MCVYVCNTLGFEMIGSVYDCVYISSEYWYIYVKIYLDY